MQEYTQLGLAERRTIEESLSKRISISKVASMLGRSRSTISRKIIATRTTQAPRGRMPACMERRVCARSCVCAEGFCPTPGEMCAWCKERDCRRFCSEFRRAGRTCAKLDQAPYVCNGCKHQGSCSVRARWYYSAAIADASSKERRSRSRQGIDMDPVRAALVLDQVRDAIARGMSPYEISVAYARCVGVSPSTIYRWVERGYAGMANIDLERKVGFKKRKGGKRKRATSHSKRHSYEAFCCLDEDVRASACEMDTVIGIKGDDACLLTLYLRACHFQIVLLLDQKAQAEVMGALRSLRAACADELFCALLAVVLTDNGSEFADERALGQAIGEKGAFDTRLYYCDVRASNQKGSCEKNHTELRQILPKGMFSFDDLTARDIAAVMSHMNSNPRKSLAGLCPIDMLIAAYGDSAEELLGDLGVRKVGADELLLKPELLNEERRKRGEEPIEPLK